MYMSVLTRHRSTAISFVRPNLGVEGFILMTKAADRMKLLSEMCLNYFRHFDIRSRLTNFAFDLHFHSSYRITRVVNVYTTLVQYSTVRTALSSR